MEPHQRRILGRIADEFDSYHNGTRSLIGLLNRAWALFEAAELRDPGERAQFMSMYCAVTTADDANQSWMPAGLGSDEAVREALVPLETWALALRDGAMTRDGDGAA